MLSEKLTTKGIASSKNWLNHTLIAGFAGLLLFTGGCDSPSSSDSGTSQQDSTETVNAESDSTDAEGSELQMIADSFSDRVVIPTYEKLVEEAEALETAVEALVSDPSDDTFKAAQEAWIVARAPWEQSEAFAFGPAESLGYDGDLDDWPVNETDVEAVLKSSDKLDEAYVKELQTTQKGFHTIELLLFGPDNDRNASDLSERELALLQQLAIAFNQTSQDLLKSWTEGVDDNPAYQEVLATAGESENPAYPTAQAAVEEIVQGMMGCLDEVANEKIGAPLEEKTTDNLESRFSHTSLDDFKHNIQSVKNAYLGQIEGTDAAEHSISALVTKADAELDEQVKGELEAAIAAVNAIPDPIEENITNEEALTKMETAQDEILTLFATMEEKVLPLVKG